MVRIHRFEVAIEPLLMCDGAIGIDVGIKHLAVTSNGEMYANPKHTFANEKQLRKWQRRLSRRKKGGTTYRKAKQKVARIHERIQNSRQDALHKLTTLWIRENQTICIEHLDINSMLSNSPRAKSISDASWGEMCRQLTYKG